MLNPYTGNPAGTCKLADEVAIDEAIDKAVSAKKEMASIPSFKKEALLRNIAQLLRENKQELGELITSENAKPIKYSLAEIDRAAYVFDIAAEECKRLPKEYIDLDWSKGGEGKEGLVKSFPVGVIAGITPFNFPLNLMAHKVAPALAAGCPIIIKPSPKTPLSAIRFAELIHEVGLPTGAFQVVVTNNELAARFVEDDRIAMISFTGSPAVGWTIKSNAGKKKVALELGGNAGVVVTDDADINLAVKRCVAGGFVYSGQVCIHGQRIFVHEDLMTTFQTNFMKLVGELISGNPMLKETDISHMITEEAAIRVEEWIKEAVAGGAKILCGGKRNGGYIEPTVLTNTNPQMKVNCQEIFGPVVTLESFSDYKTVIAEVNNSAYGLQAGVFTNDIHRINYAFNNLEVGGVIINDVPTYRMDHMPYGGVKASGFGREGIKYAIAEMTEPRILVKPAN